MQHKAFSLIELMVVIAIIAVLSAVAVPSYKTYKARTVVASVFPVLNAYKTKATAYYEINRSWPTALQLGFPSPFVAGTPPVHDPELITSSNVCINGNGSCGGMDNPSVVYAFYFALNASKIGVTGDRTIIFGATLNSDGSVDWICTSDRASHGATMPTNLLPSECTVSPT